jgi:hypothetical protein
MGLFYGFYRKPWLPTGAPRVIDIVSSGLLRLVALRSAYPLAAWITPNRGRDKKTLHQLQTGSAVVDGQATKS